jgi:RHS repeat-associated protein
LYARFDGTNAGWYLTDNLGSVRLIVTTTGTILDQLTYDSYGNNLTESSPANGDRLKYTAREWYTDVAMQDNRRRYYNPASGRWATVDPLGFVAGDDNLYRYVSNSPLSSLDPAGFQGGGGGGEGGPGAPTDIETSSVLCEASLNLASGSRAARSQQEMKEVRTPVVAQAVMVHLAAPAGPARQALHGGPGPSTIRISTSIRMLRQMVSFTKFNTHSPTER